MKVSRTNEDEILKLSRLCSELEEFYKAYTYERFEDIDMTEDDEEYFKNLYPLWKQSDSADSFLMGILRKFNYLRHQRILMNCSVLLDNCADMGLSYLDFKPELKQGTEALSLMKEMLEMGDEVTLGEMKEKMRAIVQEKTLSL
jgi:hypothetical protein